MRTPSRVAALTASVLLAGSLAACADGDDRETPVQGGRDQVQTDEPGDAGTGGEDAPGDTTTLMTAESNLGTILVDGAGRTLYVFANDQPNQSNCNDDCLNFWPPFLGEAGAGEGVDESLVGAIERSDGGIQVTYDERPLYYWWEDEEAGDTNGQGFNDEWWVVSPEGEPIGATGDGGTPTEETAGAGSGQ